MLKIHGFFMGIPFCSDDIEEVRSSPALYKGIIINIVNMNYRTHNTMLILFNCRKKKQSYIAEIIV